MAQAVEQAPCIPAGRRGAILVADAVFTVGAVLMAVAPSVAVIIVGRGGSKSRDGRTTSQQGHAAEACSVCKPVIYAV